MRRVGTMVCGALFAALAVGCAQDLSCSGGAVEINGVCECPSGAEYERSTGNCVPPDALGGDGGVRDANVAVPDASVPDASPPVVNPPAPEAGTPVVDAGAPADAGLVCPADRLACDGQCIDPSNDPKHCGGCLPCSRAGLFCQEKQCVDVGCSDGTRESFKDVGKFPAIAGCAATWPNASMLAARKIERCGNSAGGCVVPADACATGWHVCGNANDIAADLTSRVGLQDCLAQPGSFAAALGDIACRPCTDQNSAGAVCCGSKCVQQNGNCAWPGQTPWFGVRDGTRQVCGRIENPTVSVEIGVLCCRDGR